jgi:hypothetical protein
MEIRCRLQFSNNFQSGIHQNLSDWAQSNLFVIHILNAPISDHDQKIEI